jgi:hypothetical protein
MCIIQDDDEDKEREIVQMQMIYSCAGIVIAATAADACTKGFLHPRQDCQMFELQALFRKGEKGTIVVVPKEGKGYHEPLARRAWTFQECSLAPRILSYGNRQVRFFCLQQHSLAESGDGGTVPLRYREDAGFMHVTEGLAQISGSKLKTYYVWPWLHYCEQYSRRYLTFPGDKLVAISAVAQYIAGQNLFGKYFAGLWEYNLLGQLGWNMFTGEIATRPKDYRAPSWSWASIDGRPAWMDVQLVKDKDFTCRVLKVTVTPSSFLAPFSAVNSASIDITGRSREAIWRRSTGELLDSDTKDEIITTDGPRAKYRIYADAADDFSEDDARVVLLEMIGPKTSTPILRRLGLSSGNVLVQIMLLKQCDDGAHSRVGILKCYSHVGLVRTRVTAKHKLPGFETRTLTIV